MVSRWFGKEGHVDASGLKFTALTHGAATTDAMRGTERTFVRKKNKNVKDSNLAVVRVRHVPSFHTEDKVIQIVSIFP